MTLGLAEQREPESKAERKKSFADSFILLNLMFAKAVFKDKKGFCFIFLYVLIPVCWLFVPPTPDKMKIYAVFSLILAGLLALGSSLSAKHHEGGEMRDLASKLKRAVEEGKMSKEDAMAKWKAMSSSDDRKHHGKGRHDGHESHSLEAKLKKAVEEGKLTEKEAKAKWMALRGERGEGHHDRGRHNDKHDGGRHHGDHHDRDRHHDKHDRDRHHDDHDDYGQDELEEMNVEIERMHLELELKKLHFELERIEFEQDRERMRWDMERMRMDHDRQRMQREMQQRSQGPRPPHGMNHGGPQRGPHPPEGMKRPGGPPKGPPHAGRGGDSRKGPPHGLKPGGPPRGPHPPAGMKRPGGHRKGPPSGLKKHGQLRSSRD